MTTADPVPQLITLDELADRLHSSTRHVRRLIAERRIPYVKVGGLVRFDADEICTWIDANRHAQHPSLPSHPARP